LGDLRQSEAPSPDFVVATAVESFAVAVGCRHDVRPIWSPELGLARRIRAVGGLPLALDTSSAAVSQTIVQWRQRRPPIGENGAQQQPVPERSSAWQSQG